jgi:uncharacterized protein YndB with AHSA1/START domain
MTMHADRTGAEQQQLGSVEERDGRRVLRYERPLAHPPERVWRALTEPSELRGWLAAADEFDRREGGRVVLRWLNTDDEGNTAIATGTVSVFEPPRVLELDTDIHGRIRWELEGAPDGCVLTLTVVAELPDDFVTEVAAGWHVHIDFLEDALAGSPIDEWENWPRDRWERLHEAYVERDGG